MGVKAIEVGRLMSNEATKLFDTLAKRLNLEKDNVMGGDDYSFFFPKGIGHQ